MPASPTILIIPGAWHGPLHYQRLIDLLHKNDYPASCPHLITVGGPADTKMYPDSELIQHELTRLVDEGKEILVVGHSYGGIVASEAVHEQFAKKTRQNQGLSGGVVGILFVASFITPVGETLGSALGGTLPSFIHERDGLCFTVDPETRFYHDLPEPDRQYYSSKLKDHPITSLFTPLTYAAQEHHPVSYLLCANDQALPLEAQKMIVQNCGVPVREYTCSASHSPFLSQPQAMVDTIGSVIKCELET